MSDVRGLLAAGSFGGENAAPCKIGAPKAGVLLRVDAPQARKELAR